MTFTYHTRSKSMPTGAYLGIVIRRAILLLLILSPFVLNAQETERRVYYLDCSYSMVSNKLWDEVRSKLKDAIDGVENEKTELIVVPFAFDTQSHSHLEYFKENATTLGKYNLKKKIDALEITKSTKTYLKDPLADFYANRADPRKVNYMFLMTDGKDEGPSGQFSNLLSRWQNRYRGMKVYGFYVMLHSDARDSNVENVINSQKHLWKVERADVNINLVRLQSNAIFNARSDKYFELPIYGKYNGMTFHASFPASSRYHVDHTEIKNGKLRVYVTCHEDPYRLPESESNNLNITMTGGGEFDFLVTETVVVNCLSKRERSLKTSTLSSSKDNTEPFGTVEYYPSFLWVKSNIKPVTQTIEFDFSRDAQNDSLSFAEFQFVDNDGKVIGTDILQVSVDGQQLSNNSFKVGSNVTSKKITFSFTPEAQGGKHQGYLRLISHHLDRIDSQLLRPGQQVNAFQWTLKYDKCMNPLAKGLMWIIIFIASCLLLWFIILRPIFYPHFAKFTKSILIEKDGKKIRQLNYAFKGARKVIFYNQKVKQSLLKRIFVGETRTLVDPNFTSKLTFSPHKRDAIASGVGYSVRPNPIPRSGIATITNTQQKLIITLR